MPNYTPASRIDSAHQDGIWSAAWTSTDRLVTGSADEHLGVWSATGEREKRFRAACVGVVSVVAHPKDEVVASNAIDCAIRFWAVDRDEADEPAEPEAFAGLLSSIDAGPVECWKLAYSRDGRHMASGTQAGTLNVWECDSGNQVLRVETQDQFVMSVACSPIADIVACGGVDGKVNVFDLESQRLVHRLEAHAMPIRDLRFSKDGTYLFTASDDRTVNCWDAKRSFLFVQSFEGHRSWVLGLDSHPDGRIFVTGSADHTVKVWDVAGGGCVQSFDSLHADQVWATEFNDTRALLASAGEDGVVQLYNATQ